MSPFWHSELISQIKNDKPCPSEWEFALLSLVWDTKSILFQPCTSLRRQPTFGDATGFPIK